MSLLALIHLVIAVGNNEDHHPRRGMGWSLQGTGYVLAGKYAQVLM